MATSAENLERLAMYRAAEKAILEGAQEYEVEDKRFRKADLKYIQKAIRELETELVGTTPSKPRIKLMRIVARRD